MSHDIDDLLFLIKQLEERIILLERNRSNESSPGTDSYYWNHG